MKYKIKFDYQFVDTFYIFGVAVIWLIVSSIIGGILSTFFRSFLGGMLSIYVVIFLTTLGTLLYVIKYILDGITIYEATNEEKESREKKIKLAKFL